MKRTIHTAIAAAIVLIAAGCSGGQFEKGEPSGDTDNVRSSPDDDQGGNYSDTGTSNEGDTGSWSDSGSQGDTWSSKDTSDTGGQQCKNKKQKGAEAIQVLETYCSGCHGAASAGKGGFNYVTNVSKLKEGDKYIDPYSPGNSVLYTRMKSGEMPPSGKVQNTPDDSEIATVKEWIDCGAPEPAGSRQPIGTDKKLTWMEEDIRSIQPPAKREDIRYITLTHIHNGKASDKTLERYRQALSVALNSLSRGGAIQKPEPIDSAKTVYRIDITDYGWNDDIWDLISEQYPYAVSYDENNRKYGYDEVAAETIREETGTDIPYVQADWLITHGTQAEDGSELYYDILGLPDTLQELQQEGNVDLNIDLQENIQQEEVQRAGFTDSGVSDANRVIERHDLEGDPARSFWISYDFINSQDERNIQENPLDFQEDGGEIIFSLPNGLQGYYIFDAAGNRLNKAPEDVVTHKNRPDNQVQAGVSCMDCHHNKGEPGLIYKEDEIREISNYYGGQEAEQVRALYAPPQQFKETVKNDARPFQEAKKAAGANPSWDQLVMQTVLDHEDSMNLEQAARNLGISVAQLRQELTSPNPDVPEAARALAIDGNEIKRDVFDDIVPELVCAIGLGDPIDVDADVENDGLSTLDCSAVLD